MAKWESVAQWDFWGPRPRSISLKVLAAIAIVAAAVVGYLVGVDVGVLRAAEWVRCT